MDRRVQRARPVPREGGSIAERMQARVDSPLRQITPDNTSWGDIARIVALPVMGPLSPEEVTEFSRMYSLESAFRRGFRLFEVQARGINAYDEHSGMLGPMGVGDGKTLASLVIAHLAYRKGQRKILLLLPANTMAGFIQQIPWIRSHVSVNVPLHYVQGTARQREKLCSSGMPGCYIMPYSLLSTKDTVDLINGIGPVTIICDEIHKLKHANSARTQRMMKYFREHPDCELVGMSGTITSKSLEDYAHLALRALKEGAPVPSSDHEVAKLAAVLDSDARPSRDQIQKWGALRGWAREWFPKEDLPLDIEGLRRSFQLRFNSTPGVAASDGDNMINTGLLLNNVVDPQGPNAKDHEAVPGWAKVDEYIRQVREMYVAPNGDAIDHAIHTHKWLRELTAGFYNELVWPQPDVLARRMRLGVDDAQELLSRALDHHKARQRYLRELRYWLGAHEIDKLDTPMLVGADMHRQGAKRVGHKLYALWQQMKSLEFADMPEREPRAVRLCDFKVQHAVKWAAHHSDGGILWVYHIEMGKWVNEALIQAGFSNTVHCPAGANLAVLDPDNRDKLLVASISAHGTGKNLQHHQNQIFVEWPRSALLVEQALGRLHRNGQEAEGLVGQTCDLTEYDQEARAAGLNDACYTSQMLGVPQRQIYCDYDPMPRIMPAAVLRERGFENKILSDYAQLELEEKFKSPVDVAE